MEDLSKKEFDAGMAIWTELYTASESNSLAFGRIARNRAFKLRDEGRYLEAIAELDIIRWADLQFFTEASDIIIDIKREADIPYTLSEQMEVMRREDLKKAGIKDETKPEPIHRIECIYRDM